MTTSEEFFNKFTLALPQMVEDIYSDNEKIIENALFSFTEYLIENKFEITLQEPISEIIVDLGLLSRLIEILSFSNNVKIKQYSALMLSILPTNEERSMYIFQEHPQLISLIANSLNTVQNKVVINYFVLFLGNFTIIDNAELRDMVLEVDNGKIIENILCTLKNSKSPIFRQDVTWLFAVISKPPIPPPHIMRIYLEYITSTFDDYGNDDNLDQDIIYHAIVTLYEISTNPQIIPDFIKFGVVQKVFKYIDKFKTSFSEHPITHIYFALIIILNITKVAKQNVLDRSNMMCLKLLITHEDHFVREYVYGCLFNAITTSTKQLDLFLESNILCVIISSNRVEDLTRVVNLILKTLLLTDIEQIKYLLDIGIVEFLVGSINLTDSTELLTKLSRCCNLIFKYAKERPELDIPSRFENSGFKNIVLNKHDMKVKFKNQELDKHFSLNNNHDNSSTSFSQTISNYFKNTFNFSTK